MFGRDPRMTCTAGSSSNDKGRLFSTDASTSLLDLKKISSRISRADCPVRYILMETSRPLGTRFVAAPSDSETQAM